MNCGVYVITSPSGNCYVGSSQNIKIRLRVHKNSLRKGTHRNQILQHACDKYGLENLKFSKLLICSVEDLLFYEQRAMDVLRPAYNIVKTAGSCIGYKHTDEARARMSLAVKGRKFSDEIKAQMSIRQTGKKLSDETKARMSAAQKGRKLSEETLAKKRASIERNKCLRRSQP